MATDEELARAFVDRSEILKKVPGTRLTQQLAQYFGARRQGDTATAAMALESFICEVGASTGFPEDALPQVAAAVENYGGRSARYRYIAAFMKRAGHVKKTLIASTRKRREAV